MNVEVTVEQSDQNFQFCYLEARYLCFFYGLVGTWSLLQ